MLFSKNLFAAFLVVVAVAAVGVNGSPAELRREQLSMDPPPSPRRKTRE